LLKLDDLHGLPIAQHVYLHACTLLTKLLTPGGVSDTVPWCILSHISRRTEGNHSGRDLFSTAQGLQLCDTDLRIQQAAASHNVTLWCLAYLYSSPYSECYAFPDSLVYAVLHNAHWVLCQELHLQRPVRMQSLAALEHPNPR
jgi:hypothetical protein